MSGLSGSGEGGTEEGRYRFEQRIATGGMGEVWRATDRVLGRAVAVKVLKPEYADDPTFRSRFETEARNAASLHHPNVASVFDFGELPGPHGDGSPRPYLVMELVRGEPLSALLRTGEPMPAQTAADLLAQAADGLAAAHELGIVHRDIKPGNLLVTPDRIVKITDFGIARAGGAAALTQTGEVIGTPQYLSPEQAEGKTATSASDIYSLGVVLYECLAGRRPFIGDSPIATALAHLREQPPPLPDTVPAGLRDAVTVALAKDPAARFATVRDFAAALRGGPVRAATPTFADEQPTRVQRAVPAADPAANPATDPATDRAAGPTPTPAPTPGPEPRNRSAGGVPSWVGWVVAAISLLAVVALVLLLSRNSNGSPTTPQTSPSPSASQSPSVTPTPTKKPTRTPSASPAPTTVQVDKADYVGEDRKDAKKELVDLGFKVPVQVVANPDGKDQGTVADVAPSGQVEKGATITLSVYDAPSPSPSPSPSSSPTPTTSPSVSPSATSTPGSGDPGGKQP